MMVMVTELQLWAEAWEGPAASRMGLGDCWGQRGIFFSLSLGLPGRSHLLEQMLRYDCGQNSQGLEHS